METPLQLDFHGVDVPPAARDLILERVRELETRYGRITACRVVVTGPGHRHRSGGLYDIRVRLSLPSGKQVAVDRIDHGDERYSDIRFAIGDTFNGARRRLQDQALRLQGKAKAHVAPPEGIIDHIDPSREFGFIRLEDGRRVYFHRNSLVGGSATKLREGARVSFFEEEGEKGAQASTVKLLGRHRLRVPPAT